MVFIIFFISIVCIVECLNVCTHSIILTDTQLHILAYNLAMSLMLLQLIHSLPLKYVTNFLSCSNLNYHRRLVYIYYCACDKFCVFHYCHYVITCISFIVFFISIICIDVNLTICTH